MVRSATARIVEGTVERFRPVGPGGHGSDRFTVAGVELQVPTSGVGFGQTARDGGPIREGLRARIHYVPTWGCEDLCGARILRLELAR